MSQPASDMSITPPLLLLEARRALLTMRREPFPSVSAGETVELVRERRVEDRGVGAVPVVQRVLGEPDRGLRAVSELRRDVEGGRLHRVVVDTERNQPDALGFLTGERLA